MRTSLASCLDDFFLRGDETAFAYRHGLRVRRWSYRQVAEAASQFARELEARNIAKGDRVLLWAGNRPEWVVVFLGCLRRGVIAVPVDLQSEPAFVERIRDRVQARLALCDASTSAFVNASLPVLQLDDVAARIAHHSAAPYPADRDARGDTAQIIFTSGTTSDPKGVPITHGNLLANLAPLEHEIQQFLKWERLIHPVRILSVLPLSHVFGQLMGVFVPHLLGGSVFFQEALGPSEIIETVRRERVSVVACVPRLLETLRDEIALDYGSDGRTDALRRSLEVAGRSHFLRRWWTFRRIHRRFGWKFWAFVCGGATINADAEEFWQRLGFAVIEGYGMTETAALITLNHPFGKRRGSVGRALPGQELKLADDGEILVRGANVSAGYWGDSASRPADSWFRTGDAGAMDADGHLYFKGRLKDVIVTSAGMNIYPDDLERVLNRQPEVRSSTIVEIEGHHGPEAVAVLILRDEEANATVAIERANQALAGHQRVHRWVLWPDDDFPRTATQKVRRHVVTEWTKAAVDARPRPGSLPSSGGRRESMEEILSRVSGETVERLDPSARLGLDLKLDSLARVELLTVLEKRYQVEMNESALTETTTVGEIEAMVRDGTHEDTPDYAYPRWQHWPPVTWLRTALLYLIVLPVTAIMARPMIRGVDRLRGVRGPLVFVSNHVTMVDHALILLALPGRFRRRLAIAMDAETLDKWRHPPPGTTVFVRGLYLLQYVLAMLFFGGFYLPQKSGFRRSFARAGDLMDRGYNILVFPEGQRTKHGRLHPFLAGTGLLIGQLDAAVVPLRIDGLWELKRARKYVAAAGTLSLAIGEPLRYSPLERPERIARDLEDIVGRL